MEVISHITPIDNSVGVPTDSIPTVYLNIPVNKSINLRDIQGNTNTFKLALIDTSALIIAGLDTIPTEMRIDESGREIELYPHYVLPADDTVTIKFYVDVFLNNEFLARELKTVSFTTAGLRTNISETNILASYPFL